VSFEPVCFVTRWQGVCLISGISPLANCLHRYHSPPYRGQIGTVFCGQMATVLKTLHELELELLSYEQQMVALVSDDLDYANLSTMTLKTLPVAFVVLIKGTLRDRILKTYAPQTLARDWTWVVCICSQT
jgi:hypothetical protein